jgi:multicomponent K+:H+ antiporter subunit D
MNDLIVAPIILPALLAPVMAFAMRHDIVLSRVFGVAGTVALVVIAAVLTAQAATGAIQVYDLGDWPAPFGIVLVLDRLSAMMLLLTAVLALIVLLYAIGSGWDARGRHFHPLFQFLLMGVSGAFLTGDAFNLFVFFEVLLIASYGLMIHGGGAPRLRAGLQYVVMNLAGSTLFLFALGTLYAATGTLNMADLARIAREMPLDQAGLLRVAAMLLTIVFAVKAALFPVQFWLPGAYANAAAPVAAMFAILTKVGAYAILRFNTTIFGPDVVSTGPMIAQVLLPAALVTVAVGAVGVLGAGRVMVVAAFAVLASVGTLMVAVALMTPQATTAALYYTVHSTLAAAALFLVADLVMARRGLAGDALRPGPVIGTVGLVSALWFAASVAMAGLPPLSGFLGKLLILDAARSGGIAAGWVWTVWAVILTASLMQVVGFARAGSLLFWKPHEGGATVPRSEVRRPPSAALALSAVIVACAGLFALSVLAGPAARYFEAASLQLHDAPAYIAAVLGTPPERLQ